MMTVSLRCRLGFTAIELVIVLTMASIILATSVPPVLSAMRRNAVSRSAEAIVAVAEEARRLSRAPRLEDTRSNAKGMYGVAVVVPSSGPAYAELLYGQNDGDTLKNALTGEPLLRKYLNANVLPYTESSTTGTGRRSYVKMSTGKKHWFYSPNLGRVVKRDGTKLEVGTGDWQGLSLVQGTTTSSKSSAREPIPPDPAQFGVVLLDDSYAVGLAFFHIGLSYSREIPPIVGR